MDEIRMTLQMPKAVYDELLEIMRPHISKKNTNYRPCKPAELRLALTLRYLAFGGSYLDLHQQFCVGRSTVGSIIAHTTRKIYKALKKEYLAVSIF